MALVRLHVTAPLELLDAIGGCLLEAGVDGIEERDGGLSVYSEEGDALDRLHHAMDLFARTIHGGEAIRTNVETVDPSWQDTWKLALGPVAVTERLTFRPMHAPDVEQDETTLWFEARTSFGDGDHPTTRLMATALEGLGRESPGRRLLDVGCGSGVLSLVALASGFESALGVDIEEESVRASRVNARLNDLLEHFEVRHGSADSVDERFEVVAANILTPVLVDLAKELRRRVAPGGTLLLSGIHGAQHTEVLEAMTQAGFRLLDSAKEDDWHLLVLRG